MNCDDKTVIRHPHCLWGGDRIFNIKAVRCISLDLVAEEGCFPLQQTSNTGSPPVN